MGKKFLFNPIEGQFDIVAGEAENCLLAMSALQGGMNANTVVNLLDNILGVTVNNNIVFNNTTHRATLKAGKTYKIQAFVRHDGSVSNTASNYAWYNATDSVWIGKTCQISSLDSPSDDGTQSTTTAIITPSTDIEVELRCLGVSAPNQGVRDDATYATIEKISETFTNIVFVPSIEVDYLQASKANDQINFSTNTDVIFDAVDRSAGSAISLNTTTGIFTLKGGKTYKLTCGLRFEHTAAAKIGFAWYDITNSAEISVMARIHTMSEAGEKSNIPIIQTIITPTVDTEVSVRCVWDGDGVEDINAGYAWAIVEKISERVLIQSPVEKEWTDFTPSVEATTTAPALATTHKKKASYKVVGKSLHIIWSYSHIVATGATAGSGDYLFPIPAGYTIDTSKVDIISVENTFGYGTPVGNGNIMEDNSWGSVMVGVHDTNNLKLIACKSNTGFYVVQSGWYSVNVNNKKIMFTAEVPIL